MNIITRVDPSKLPYIMPDMSVDARSPLKRTSWGSTFESTYSKCHVNICIWKGWKRMKRGEWVFSEVFDVFINIVDDNRTLVPFTPSIHHNLWFIRNIFPREIQIYSEAYFNFRNTLKRTYFRMLRLNSGIWNRLNFFLWAIFLFQKSGNDSMNHSDSGHIKILV